MEKYQTYKINREIENADVIIPYEDSVYHLSGISGTDQTQSIIIISLDKKTVSFLFGGDYFFHYKLEKNSKIRSENIQQKISLGIGESELVTYYPEENYEHRTSAIELVMPNGDIYTAETKDGNEYLGLNW